MRRPLLALAGAFGLGCLLAGAGRNTLEAIALVSLAAALLAASLAAGEGRAAMAGLGGAALALGVAAASVEAMQVESQPLWRLAERGTGRVVRLVGSVRGDSEERDGRLTFRLAVDAIEERSGHPVPTEGRARLEVAGEDKRPRLLDGQRLAVWAALRAPRRGAGDEVFASCKSARLVERLPEGGAPLRLFVARRREEARAAFARWLLPGVERGLVQAMVLGDRSGIDAATSEAFRASGTYHVLALSGAQVAMVAALLVFALRALRAGPWTTACVTASAVGLYAVFVGGDVPVVRASLMASAVLLGRAIDVDTDVANLLGLAALVLLVARPSSAGDVGFQLSFGATLGILALAGPLTQGWRRLPLRVDLAVAASIAAQGVLAPVLASWFHRLAPAAIVLNILAVPLSGVVLLGGLGVLAAQALGAPVASAAGDVAWVTAHALRRCGDLGPLGPWLDLRVPSPTWTAVASWTAGLGLLRRGRRVAGLGLLLASHVALVAGRPGAADGRLHLTVVDVGQGDSLLLRSPSGRALLVDAGGSRDPRFDPGERRVAPELWRLGVRRLDAVLVTHAHPDHVGGVPFLLRAFRVGELWEGPAPLRDPVWRGIDERFRALGAARRSLAAGARLDWDGVRLRVLGPRPPRRPPWRVRNEDSVVLDVSLGEVHLLLTGDVAGDAEAALVVPQSVVVKVAHHGSRSSSGRGFVEAAAPRLALVSAGAHNTFGHPHPEVLERYRTAGALVLRTDRDGTIEVATDGTRVWVRTWGEAQARRIR
jgi:competence protein ComEC